MFEPNSRHKDACNQNVFDSYSAPKPLHIAKRGLKKSQSVNTSRTLSTSSTLGPIVPARKSSILSNSSESECTSKALQCVNRDKSSILSQHRYRPAVHSSTAVPFRSGVRRSSETNGPQGQPHSRSIMNDLVADMADSGSRNYPKVQAGPAVQSTARRAFTTGSFKRETSSDFIKNEESLSVPPDPLVIRRRAVTDFAPICGGTETITHNDGHVLRKQPSHGKTLFSRMMNSIPHRLHTDPPPVMDQDTDKRRSSEEYRMSNTQVHNTRDRLGRISESSGGTDGSNDSYLENTLATFPTPPTSAGTSPRPSENFRFSQPGHQPLRNLKSPEDASIMGAELTLTAEHDELSSDNGNSMLVAIDIEGGLNSVSNGHDLWSQHTGLDVVVIIDNS